MKLTAISVYGLFGEYDFELALVDGRMTFIHSPNGLGKTTILEMVNLALSGSLKRLEEVPFNRMDIFFDGGECLIVENGTEGISVQMQKNEVEEELDPNDLRSVIPVSFIPSGRLWTYTEDGMMPSMGSYALNLAERIKDAKEHSEISLSGTGGKSGLNDHEFESYCKDLKAKMDFMRQSGLDPSMPSGYRFPPSRMEIIEYRKDYEEIVKLLQGYIDLHFDLAESIVVYMDIVNGMFINKEVYLNERGQMNFRAMNGTALPMNKLSSGENQILVIFYRVLFNTKRNSLVMIDEPEMSLHVTWQQQLGGILMDVARLRGLQIVIATHSPQIIHDKWDLATEMKVRHER